MNSIKGITYNSNSRKNGRSYKSIRREEEIKFGPERDKRLNFNDVIVDMILKGWPEEEMQIYLEKHFPDYSSDQIRSQINHWKEQNKKIISILDEMMDGVINGETTLSEVKFNLSNRPMFKSSLLFRKLASQYLNHRISELKDIEK